MKWMQPVIVLATILRGDAASHFSWFGSPGAIGATPTSFGSQPIGGKRTSPKGKKSVVLAKGSRSAEPMPARRGLKSMALKAKNILSKAKKWITNPATAAVVAEIATFARLALATALVAHIWTMVALISDHEFKFQKNGKWNGISKIYWNWKSDKQYE